MRIEETLKNLSLADLSQLCGEELIQGLGDLGVSTTKSSLIELLLTAKGLSFLENKKCREIIFSKPSVISELNIDLATAQNLIKSSFSYSASSLAALFDADIEDLKLEAEKRQGEVLLAGANGSLFPYQNWMRKRVSDFFRGKHGVRTLVHMPTGAGKTRTAMNIVIDQVRPNTPGDVTIVWLAHSDELCEQAVQSFTDIWNDHGISQAKVWRMWGGQSQLEDFDGRGVNFVVTSFQTLHGWIKASTDARFVKVSTLKRSCDLLIVDEAHLSTAPTYRQVIDYISGLSTNIVGLTATPGRHSVTGDGQETIELSEFYENNLIEMTNDEGEATHDPIGFLQSKGVLSDVEQFELPGLDIELPETELAKCREQLEIPESVLKMLGNDAQRTLNVAAKTMRLAVEEQKQTIVFCPSKANAQIFAEYLKLQGCAAAAITGDLPMSIRQRHLSEFKAGKIQVLTNFNVLTTGFDAPNIGAVIIARPTMSVVLYSQMIGRGLRGALFGGTPKTTIVNVKDNIVNLPDFRSAFVYFNEFFQSKEAK